MLIGELARRSGVPAKTLRFYEQVGVLAPPQRTDGGYRNYDEDAVDRLSFIRSAQAAGLTLVEIRQIITIRHDGAAPCTHVAELLGAKAEAVASQIEELERLQRQLQRLHDQAIAMDPGSCDPRTVCNVFIEPR